MSKYKNAITCIDINMTEDELRNMYKSLSYSTKFELRQGHTNASYNRYKLIFKAFYYDCDGYRKYLLTNDERRSVMKKFNYYITVGYLSKPDLHDVPDRTYVGRPEEISKVSETQLEELVIDSHVWKVLAKQTDKPDCETFLVTTTIERLIDALPDCVTDSITDSHGNELLDRMKDAEMMRLIATCMRQDGIRKMFPHVDRIWCNGRVTSIGRYDNFRVYYLKMSQDELVTAKIYNIAVNYNGSWILRYI